VADEDMKIEWGTPPKVRSGGQDKETVDHHVFAAALRSRKGVWGKVPQVYKTRQVAAAVALYINRATGKAYLPPGHFRAVSRTVAGEHLVYACYVGEE
jgi:hypothetical protein